MLVAQDIFLRVHLDTAALVAHIDEHAFAHVAMRSDAARDGDLAAFGVIRPCGVAGFGWGKFVFERINALGAQGREFGFALFDQGIQRVLLLFHLQTERNTNFRGMSKFLQRGFACSYEWDTAAVGRCDVRK